jgi:hypothetical protein
MVKKHIGLVLWAFSAGLTVAWAVEALTYGRGVISKYVAPFAVIGNIVAAFIIRRQKASKAAE